MTPWSYVPLSVPMGWWQHVPCLLTVHNEIRGVQKVFQQSGLAVRLLLQFVRVLVHSELRRRSWSSTTDGLSTAAVR